MSIRIDFTDTKAAFANKSDKKLREIYYLFKMMNYPVLVNLGSFLTVWALKLHIPFVKGIVKNTIFEQFCGGTSLLDCQSTIDELYSQNVLTILDYGVESIENEDDYNAVTDELLNALDFAASNPSTPVIAVKLTGLTDRKLLEKLTAGKKLDRQEQRYYNNFYERINTICQRSRERGVAVFIDAEETWLQDEIDRIAIEMSREYNKERITVYNTYQMYRKDALENLKRDHKVALEEGYILGAKVVRGAYMDKENNRAEEMGYETPINPSKETTNKLFDESMYYSVEHYETLASCCATHNKASSLLYAQLIEDLDVPNDHLHLNFAQLYGMSDDITFNLSPHGYNVAKYLPYGKITDVIPYLIRRAQENTSVTGDMSRELNLIYKEMKRRGMVK